ncbi:MAG: HDOD domain-containing protein [Syntrophobacteraceae bacterium]
MDRINTSQIFRILESGYALPPLSVIALRLLEVASDEDASNEQIVRTIEQDPSLTVRLLNLSNSALFGTGRPTASLSRAVMKLGHNQIRLMALSISLRDAFPMGKVERFDYELFWRVSLYRGLIAQSLAQQSEAANQEEAFLCGLTMEIGLPILFDMCIRGRTNQFSLDLEPLEELLEKESACYGMNHREVGAAALRFWKFPDHIVACQEVHPENLDSNSSSLWAVCRLARLFSQVIVKETQAFASFYSEAEAGLGLSKENIHDAVFQTLAEVEKIAQGFKLQIDRQRDMIAILENANRALVRISQTVSRYPEERHEKNLPSFSSIDRKDRSVEDALQAVAHEIRNPLTAVGGFARRLAVSLDPESQSGKYARVILDEVLRLEKILSEMPEQSLHPACGPSEKAARPYCPQSTASSVKL